MQVYNEPGGGRGGEATFFKNKTAQEELIF